MITIEDENFDVPTHVRYVAKRDNHIIVGLEIEAGWSDMVRLSRRLERSGCRSESYPTVRTMVAELSVDPGQFVQMFGDAPFDELLDTPDGAFARLSSKAYRRFAIAQKVENGLMTPMVEMDDPYIYVSEDPSSPVAYLGPAETAWEQVGWLSRVPNVADNERYEMWLARFNASLAAWNGSRATNHSSV